MTKKLISFFLALALLAALFASLTVGVGADEDQPENSNQTTRTIAIVFDNSGTMYGYYGDPVAWCRATYAVEVFAAMMNPGDKLKIYPMGPIHVENMQYSDTEPLIIESKEEIGKIEKMQTDKDTSTPIETIDRAAGGLRDDENKAAEKWLIILTDGAQFDKEGPGGPDDRVPLPDTTEQLSNKIKEILDDGMNVIYLGIGNLDEPVVKVPDGVRYEHAKAADASQVTQELSKMCNKIFGRYDLNERKRLNVGSGKIDVNDVPMKKLIAFIQGPDINNVKLIEESSGKEVAIESSVSTKFSETGMGDPNYVNPKTGKIEYTYHPEIDENLQGKLVTFGYCEAGTYKLSYSGNSTSVNVYYEPDVNISPKLLRKDGDSPVDVSGETTLFPGEYVISVGLVDSQEPQGNPIDPESDLIAPVNYKVDFTKNGQPGPEGSYNKDSKCYEVPVSLKTDDEITNFSFVVTYLGYTLEEKDVSKFGWPNGFSVIPVAHDLMVECVSPASGQSYGLSTFPGDTKFCFVYKIKENGEYRLLTAEELKGVTPAFQVDGLNSDDYVMTQDGYDLTLHHLGEMKDTECREYTLTASGTYMDGNGDKSPIASTSVAFSIVNDGSTFGLSIEAPQKYFEISKLDDGKPITVHLTKDGAPMNAEDFAAAKDKFRIDADFGEDAYDLTYDPENSAVILKLKKDDSLTNGYHWIKCSFTLANNIGVELTAEDSVRIEVRPYPQWLPWVIAGGIIAGLAALIAFIMTRKVLPKKIIFDPDLPAEVLVGSKVIGEPDIRSSGKGNRGQLMVSMQAVNYQASDGVTLNLVAESKRYVKSSRRKVKIVSGNFLTPNARSLIAGDQFKVDKGGTAVVNMEGENALDASLASGDYFTMTTRINNRSFTIRGTLLFR